MASSAALRKSTLRGYKGRPVRERKRPRKFDSYETGKPR